MIELDGNYLEGGGQIVRTALSLSTLLNKPFRIINIRQGRPHPGLKAQHMSCISSLEKWTSSKAVAHLGSTSLEFYPGKVKPHSMTIDIGTAGSITMLLHCLILPAVFSSSRVKFKIVGGTDVKWSPPIDYFARVFLPQLRKFCDQIELRTELRGFYPKGQGIVNLLVNPKQLSTPINLNDQGKLAYLKGISFASSSLKSSEVAERQTKAAESKLYSLNCNTQIASEYSNTASDGSGTILWAVFSFKDDSQENPVILGADSLGQPGKRAEIVGNEAADQLLTEINSNAPVDKFLADQLLPYLAFSGGSFTTSQITNHTKTNIYTIEKFMGKIFYMQGNKISVNQKYELKF